MKKLYFVESEMCPRLSFTEESDRNEMALALWQEHIYFLGARIMNWYDCGIMRGIEDDANSNVSTWDIVAPRTFYETPTQVAYWDVDGDHYVGGIAYQDAIICACCGGIMDINEIIEFAPCGVNPIVEYNHWLDISYEVMDDKEIDFKLEDDDDKDCDD